MLIYIGDKPYQCSHCDTAYSQAYNLIDHLITPTEKRDFINAANVKRFSQNSHFKRYLRIHIGERHYQFSECDKAFSNNTAINAYLSVNTGERSYQCNKCENPFSKKIIL